MSRMYLLDNGKEIALDVSDYKYSVEDDMKEHIYQLVVEYVTPDERTRSIKSEKITVEHTHEWIDATCTAPKTCKLCGKTEGEALPHTESDWIVDTDATCKEEGKQHTECTVCHTTLQEESIPTKAHTWVEATCTAPKTCSVCGETEGEALLHTESDWIVDSDATCKEEGKKHTECTVCHETLKEESIPTKEHTWVDATCAAPKTCSVCGKTEGEALPHTESDWIVDTDATCTSEGKQHIECTVCHKTLKEEKINKLPHTESNWIVDKAATCKEEGKQHIECTVCHETLKEESISKKNHTWADATTEAPKTCTVCGITEGDKLPKKKGCKKSSIGTIILGISLLCASIYVIRKKK